MRQSGFPKGYRGRDKMTLEEFIADVEACNFRTAHDVGANLNAMFIWNILRDWAGMQALEIDDLHRNHARTDGKTFEEVKRDYIAYMDYKAREEEARR